MSLNLVLIVLGIVLVAFGVYRIRGPWARYQQLRAQEENIARYESWRGGVRDTSPTGASVAMEMLRKRLRSSGYFIGAGVALILAGLFLG
jgi:hypothetical protein